MESSCQGLGTKEREKVDAALRRCRAAGGSSVVMEQFCILIVVVVT